METKTLSAFLVDLHVDSVELTSLTSLWHCLSRKPSYGCQNNTYLWE